MRIEASVPRATAFANLYAMPTEISPRDRRTIIELCVHARREGIPLASLDALQALNLAPSLAVTLLAECDSIEERGAFLDMQRQLPFLWASVSLDDWLAAFDARIGSVQARLTEAGLDPWMAIPLTRSALTDIAALRPELLEHARIVYLTKIAPAAYRAKKSFDVATLQRPQGSRDGRRETSALIARHDDARTPAPTFLSPSTRQAQAKHWDKFDPQWADVIAAPFAVADHTCGVGKLSIAEVRRCREGWLFDPEFFESILPVAIQEAVHQSNVIS
jgi:hypothetical protein